MGMEGDDLKTKTGIRISTPWVSIEGSGIVAIMCFLTALICALMIYAMYINQQEHRALVGGINDLFIASMTPPEMKSDLPPMLKEKLKDKAQEKATRRLEEQ